MENEYQRKEEFKMERTPYRNEHIPEWAKYLIELYHSSLKYKVKYGTDKN
jgi:hypothetical protein